jgi:uncharacterized protein
MGRVLLLIVALFVLIWLVRGVLITRRRAAPPPASATPAGELVHCAHCGVLVPRAESRSAGGRDYCSEEHGRLGPRENREPAALRRPAGSDLGTPESF